MIRHAVRLLIAILLVTAPRSLIAGYPENPFRVGDSIYVSHQGIYRFDSAQGEPRWSSLEGVQTFEPVVHGERLLVGSTRGLYALDIASGRIAWHIEQGRTIFSPSLSRLAYAGSVHGELYAIEPADGRIHWRRRFDGWIYSPAINSASAMLFTGGQSHKVSVLSTADGGLRREITTSQETVFSPVDLGDDRIGVNLFDGSTLVFDARSAQLAGILEGDSQPTGLRRRGQTIYRSHGDGSLLAFDAASLALKWQQKLVDGNLIMHPSGIESLLVGDRDRQLILFRADRRDAECRIESDGRDILPVQIDEADLVVFRAHLKPPLIRLVQVQENCQ